MELRGNQGLVGWGDGEVLTLKALWPRSPLAVIVGINPAPRSVQAGHYYQGRAGQFAIGRLRQAGVLSPPRPGWAADDQAVLEGIAFTDLVPRPTSSAKEVQPGELVAGAERLRRAVLEHRPRLIIAVFKPPVVALLGPRHGAPGLQDATFHDTAVFKLTHQCAEKDLAEQNLHSLTRIWRDLVATAAGADP